MSFETLVNWCPSQNHDWAPPFFRDTSERYNSIIAFANVKSLQLFAATKGRAGVLEQLVVRTTDAATPDLSMADVVFQGNILLKILCTNHGWPMHTLWRDYCLCLVTLQWSPTSSAPNTAGSLGSTPNHCMMHNEKKTWQRGRPLQMKWKRQSALKPWVLNPATKILYTYVVDDVLSRYHLKNS